MIFNGFQVSQKMKKGVPFGHYISGFVSPFPINLRLHIFLSDPLWVLFFNGSDWAGARGGTSSNEFNRGSFRKFVQNLLVPIRVFLPTA